MKLYNTTRGIFLENENDHWLLSGNWDEIVNRDDLYTWLAAAAKTADPVSVDEFVETISHALLPPIGSQEVWAAGVTYLRSRDARMEESEETGGADFYQKVYEAERPELFFKSLPHKVVGHGQEVNIRKDSSWNVPEPELTLFINSNGNIEGYTNGNDMSSRSIEGENPLYLPQAKMYERSAAIGPCLFVPAKPVSLDTQINLRIEREGKILFDDSVTISRMKRSLTELAGWLYKESSYPDGCYLMTGTCLVPPNDFTLHPGDIVYIRIDGIGTLMNTVAEKK